MWAQTHGATWRVPTAFTNGVVIYPLVSEDPLGIETGYIANPDTAITLTTEPLYIHTDYE